MYKVLSDEITEKVKVERLLREFGARAVAIRKDFIVFETTGHREETNKLMEALAPFGLVEFVRSARVAIIKESAGFHEKLKDFEIDLPDNFDSSIKWDNSEIQKKFYFDEKFGCYKLKTVNKMKKKNVLDYNEKL